MQKYIKHLKMWSELSIYNGHWMRKKWDMVLGLIRTYVSADCQIHIKINSWMVIKYYTDQKGAII